MTDSHKPRRRWFRFSLRTLFLLVTLAAVASSWVVYQLNWISQRHESLNWAAMHGANGTRSIRPTPAPWSIRIFGEPDGELQMIVTARNDEDRKQVENLKRLFPEREIWIGDEF